MSKILEMIGGALVAIVATGASAAEKTCEIASSAACTAGQAVSGVMESVAAAATGKKDD
jgi:hypothetical protein